MVGIKTGLNSAFILDVEQVKELTCDFTQEVDIYKPYLIGDDVQRYFIKANNKYILFPYDTADQELPLIDLDEYPNTNNYLNSIKDSLSKRAVIKDIVKKQPNRWYSLQQINKKINFDDEKIIYPDIGKELRFTIDSHGHYIDMTVFIIPSNDRYVLSILNSKLTKFQLNSICAVIGDVGKGGRLRFKSQYLENLLIRKIKFTTSNDDRSRLAEELKGLCAVGKFEKVLELVGDCLPKDEAGGFVAEGEMSDVVHDLLAHLAEEMIRMNKEKQDEIKKFLGWLENDMGARVDELTNKTKIQAYYEIEFPEFLAVLNKNKKKIQVDYSRYDPNSRLLEAFNTSLSRLKPLIGKIEETDRLIDQVVYKLYGLTDEEIGIVEDAIAK